MSEYNNNQEMGWSSTIDSVDVSLEPGDYKFTVAGMSKQRHTHDASKQNDFPTHNYAEIKLHIVDPKTGLSVTVNDNLRLLANHMWRVSGFFESIGQKQKNQPLTNPNWNIEGATGYCSIVQKPGKDGRTFTNVGKYYARDDVTQEMIQKNTPAPAQTQPTGWNPGAF